MPLDGDYGSEALTRAIQSFPLLRCLRRGDSKYSSCCPSDQRLQRLRGVGRLSGLRQSSSAFMTAIVVAIMLMACFCVVGASNHHSLCRHVSAKYSFQSAPILLLWGF